MFNFQPFFEKHHIEYVTRGPNVASGNINIQCPFCAASDPSHHLGVSLETGKWGCWRRADHRGIKPHRLIRALLRCSPAEAATIAGTTGPELGEFDNYVASWFQDPEIIEDAKILTLPREIQFLGDSGMSMRFISYLKGRGYDAQEIDELAIEYDLHYCLTGEWKDRLIFPVHSTRGLVSWTGRSIHPDEKIRYKSLSLEESVLNIKHTLFNFVDLIGESRDTLVITEGPFDAMRVDYLGYEDDIRSTCLFGTSISEQQVLLLSEISSFYSRKVILFDNATLDAALHVASELSMLSVEVDMLPAGVDDPAEMSLSQVRALSKKN